MIKVKLINNKQGLTLIELILTFAILLIVIGVSFSFFFFNLRSFQTSEKLSQVQFDVRMASDLITSELRNVNQISLTDDTLPNSIILSKISSKYPLVKSVNFSIVNQSPNYYVSYLILGSDSNSENSYQLESEVLLNNITSATEGNDVTIYYSK